MVRGLAEGVVEDASHVGGVRAEGVGSRYDVAGGRDCEAVEGGISVPAVLLLSFLRVRVWAGPAVAVAVGSVGMTDRGSGKPVVVPREAASGVTQVGLDCCYSAVEEMRRAEGWVGSAV